MADLDDYDLDPGARETLGSGTPPRRTGDGLGWVVAVVVLTALVGGAAYWWLRRTPAAPEAQPPAEAARLTTPSATPTPTPAVALPTLDNSDAFVRSLAQGLSSLPGWAAWLAPDDLIRRFVAAVDAVAEGASPRAPLGFLAPRGGFAVSRESGQTVVDRRSYARYDAVGDVIESLDGAACARVLATLMPLVEAAYREMGTQPGGFQVALARASAQLREVPVVDDPVGVRPVDRGGLRLYEYTDPRLESLSPAQKHLLRMGPRNVRRIEAKLEELARVLSVRPEPSATAGQGGGLNGTAGSARARSGS